MVEAGVRQCHVTPSQWNYTLAVIAIVLKANTQTASAVVVFVSFQRVVCVGLLRPHPVQVQAVAADRQAAWATSERLEQPHPPLTSLIAPRKRCTPLSVCTEAPVTSSQTTWATETPVAGACTLHDVSSPESPFPLYSCNNLQKHVCS